MKILVAQWRRQYGMWEIDGVYYDRKIDCKIAASKRGFGIQYRDQMMMPVTNARNVDEKTVAERTWRTPLKPAADQKPCDAGLFSDDHKQKEMFP